VRAAFLILSMCVELYPLATAGGKMCKYGKHWIRAVKAGT